MAAWILKLVRRVAMVLAVAVLLLLGYRAYDTQTGAPLEPWHIFIPQELTAAEMDKADWPRYLQAEDAIFQSLHSEVTQKLPPDQRIPVDRYFEGSPVYPEHFSRNWNRSFVLEPDAAPVGAVVLLHGMTDSPYSLRHVAQLYRDRGFVAIAVRLPAHGTVPGALTEIEWEDWLAATRLVVREARRRIGPSLPLHLVGYSNGGALAVKYSLDAIGDPVLTRADRIVLISPMIGVSPLARFATIAAWPAIIPAFAKAKWLSVLPEFNPFKYNSFPVNAARQSHRLTTALQEQIADLARQNRLAGLPPILAFQSVVDFTVSTRAVITALFDKLPANGSELVLFDINRSAKTSVLFQLAAETELSRLLSAPPRNYRTTVVTNASEGHLEMVAHVTEAGATTEQTRDLAVSYPSDVYSLSHVALPFPVTDGLYGLQPSPDDKFGITLGSTSTRGEVGVLIINLDSLLRLSSNPFFPFMLERIGSVIP